MTRWITLVAMLAFLLGSCTAMAGGVSHYPASGIAVILILGLKLVNDRLKMLAWPMEFLLFSAVILILANLTRLYFLPIGT